MIAYLNLGIWEILFLLFPFLGVGGYMLPTIVGLLRNKKSLPMLLINIFFGWTIIGWIYAFYLALKK